MLTSSIVAYGYETVIKFLIKLKWMSKLKNYSLKMHQKIQLYIHLSKLFELLLSVLYKKLRADVFMAYQLLKKKSLQQSAHIARVKSYAFLSMVVVSKIPHS